MKKNFIKEAEELKKIKELDRKMFVGAGLTLAFLILYLLTLPYVSYSDPYSKLTDDQKNVLNIEDNNYYDKALLFENASLCESIINASMKKQCTARFANVQINEPTEETIKDVDDKNNYDMALLFADATRCEAITAEQLKAQCLAKLEGRT